jgi:hypothetical protein
VGISRDYPLKTRTSKQPTGEIPGYELIPSHPLKYLRSKPGLRRGSRGAPPSTASSPAPPRPTKAQTEAIRQWRRRGGRKEAPIDSSGSLLHCSGRFPLSQILSMFMRFVFFLPPDRICLDLYIP